jgi:1,4-alpha-glucan branching enzyme
MHDTLDYFAKDPVHRKWHHNRLTFGLMYIFSENFLLPLSHDEVVHGKGSLLGRMPGDEAQKFANLRGLYAWMWAHPGKKLLFMGGEFAQRAEWNHDASLDWHLLESSMHAGVSALVRDLNHRLREEPALYDLDSDSGGFEWLQADSAEANVYAFVRWSGDRTRHVVCIANLSPVPRYEYRVGMPQGGSYAELLNSDAVQYGGAGVGNGGLVACEDVPCDNQPRSARVTLPRLGAIWLAPHRE